MEKLKRRNRGGRPPTYEEHKTIRKDFKITATLDKLINDNIKIRSLKNKGSRVESFTRYIENLVIEDWEVNKRWLKNQSISVPDEKGPAKPFREAMPIKPDKNYIEKEKALEEAATTKLNDFIKEEWVIDKKLEEVDKNLNEI